ncbi:hypothetical protein [Photobacterium lucens]|nr:hypothetical protein [Photobacterium lucens]
MTKDIEFRFCDNGKTAFLPTIFIQLADLFHAVTFLYSQAVSQ